MTLSTLLLPRFRPLLLVLLAASMLFFVGQREARGADGKSRRIVAQASEEKSPRGKKTSDATKKDVAPAEDAPKEEPDPFSRRSPAPPLDSGEWINTVGQKPIDLKKLRGKFVILDFWTYCCINCMHILPQLKKLEHAYPNEVVVIGVHSAKFDGEQDPNNVQEAVLRYEIEHPVVNDAQHKIWESYEINSWPSLRVIDPEGNLVAGASGEIDFETLDKFLKNALPYYRQKKLLDLTPLRFELAAYKAPTTPLRFPGKLLADEKSDRLYIADSNHNRIVVAKLDGTLVDTIGSGQIGAADGNYAKAGFDHPQGLALAGDVLYVADTENHLIRKVELKKKQVHTVAGTGKQSQSRSLGGAPLKTALNSPWALVVHDHALYIAMAGFHQIWKMPLAKSEIGPFAGNGREDIVNGLHLGDVGASSFAQPSGLSSDGTVLYVADSEGSSIRAVPFDPDVPVTTVVGTAGQPIGRLFTFGDVDGQGPQVRLQHALEVLDHDGLLYVADTYNNKIKVIDPATATSKTLVGTGKAGADDSPASFDEPAGLAFAKGVLYVADTNNHLIRTIDLKDGNRVATLEIKGLAPPEPSKSESKPRFPGATHVDLPAAKLKAVDGKLRLQVALELPDGYKINPLAPIRYLVEAASDAGPVNREAIGKLVSVEGGMPAFDIELPATTTGSDKLRVSLGYYYCQSGAEGVCKAGNVIWNLSVSLADDAADSSVQLPFKVQ